MVTLYQYHIIKLFQKIKILHLLQEFTQIIRVYFKMNTGKLIKTHPLLLISALTKIIVVQNHIFFQIH